MKVVVLNGLNPLCQAEYRFRDIVGKSFALDILDCKISDLHTQIIHKCRGCFDCWIKNPGECL